MYLTKAAFALEKAEAFSCMPQRRWFLGWRQGKLYGFLSSPFVRRGPFKNDPEFLPQIPSEALFDYVVP